MSSCDSICIGERILLFLWFVSVPTYCMVIYTIWKHRKTKFKGEFWFLSMSLFVADILHLCQHKWSQKVSSWGLVPDVLLQVTPKLIGWFMFVPHWAFFCAEAMGVVFVSINRYLAIMKPEQHSLWTRKTTIVCICAQWAVAVFVFLFNIPVRFSVVWNNGSADNSSGFTVIIDPAFSKMMSMFVGVLFGLGGLVRVVLFAILYTRMFYYVYKQKRVVASSGNQQQRSGARSELNLAIIGAMLALCDVVLTLNALKAAVVIGKGKASAEEMRVGSFISACFMDIYGWMNGWLLLAFCSLVRKLFLKQYGFVKSTESTVRVGGCRTQPRSTKPGDAK